MNDALRPKADATLDPEPAFDDADVERVVEVGSAMKRDVEDKLTLEEVKEVGREVGLEERYVERAADQVAHERRVAKAEAEAEVARRVILLRRVAIGVGAVVAVFLVAMTFAVFRARSRMQTAIVDVEAAQSQVDNVIARQKNVQARYKDQRASVESEAEISGAENRVRIERRRYDEAAAAYNGAARDFGGGVAQILFDFPGRVPMSNQVSGW